MRDITIMVLVAGAFLGCQSADPPIPVVAAPARLQSVAESDAALLARGAAAWQRGMCNKCHGDDANGGPRAPDLTDDEWLHCDGSVEGVLAVLKRGVPKSDLHVRDRPFAMNPASNLVPDAEDLAALAAYVVSLSRGST